MADNEFLNGVRIEQFIKSNNEQVKDSLTDVNKTLTTGFKSMLATQKSQLTSLKSIEKTSKSIDKSMSKILSNQDKMIKALGGRVSKSDALTNTSMKKFMQEVAKQKTAKDVVKKDTFKRKNFDADNNELLGLMTGKLDVISKMKPTGAGLMAGIGGLFAGGGLIGYLMTGKKEMLGNIAKGLQIGLMGAKSILPAVAANSPILKAIPGLGLIVSLITGVSRFKRGDVEGGLIDIAGGLAGLVPGIGTAVSVALGVYQMKRDLTMSTEEQASSGEVITSYWSNPENLKKIPGVGAMIYFQEGQKLWAEGKYKESVQAYAMSGMSALIPGFGAMAGLVNFVKDEGGVTQASGTAGRAVRGMFTGNFASNADTEASNRSQQTASRLRSMSASQKEQWNQFRGGVSATTEDGRALLDQFMTSNNITEPEADAIVGGSSTFGVPRVIGAAGMPSSPFDFSNMFGGGRAGSSSAYYTQPGVDIGGVKGDVWHNFNGMFSEFNSLMDEQHPGHKNKFGMRGNTVQINSGYRSIEKQRELYAQYLRDKAAGKNPSPVAVPGRSMHNYGMALDINSPEANIMGGNGAVNLRVPGHTDLMKKWGFDRPVRGEAWHVEPKGLDYAKVRSGVSSGGDSGGGGSHTDPLADAIEDINLPQGRVDRKATNNTPLNVMLSTSDIDALAMAFGKQLKNIPKSDNRPIVSNAGSPRSNL